MKTAASNHLRASTPTDRLARALGIVAGCALELTGLAAPVTALTFSPDGTALVCSVGRSVQVRDPLGATVLREWPCPIAKITTLRFDPTGRLLAVAGGTPGERGEVRLLAWPEGRWIGGGSLPSDLATGLDFDPTGSRFVVSGAEGVARIWPVTATTNALPESASPEPEVRLEGHSGPILAVAWDPGGTVIATTGADRSIKVWEPSSGRLIRSFTQHTEAPLALAFRPRLPAEAGSEPPAVCATGGDDRTVRLWQPGIGRMIRIVRPGAGSILALAWMPDGLSLIAGGTDGTSRVIDAASDEVLATISDHADWIFAVAVSPDGSRVASGDASGQIRVRPSFALPKPPK